MVQGVRIKDHWSEQRIFDQRTFAAGIIIVTLTLIRVDDQIMTSCSHRCPLS